MHDVIACRRDRCYLGERCELREADNDGRPEYGRPCPLEIGYALAYERSFMQRYAPGSGLEHDHAREIARDLAILELRRGRLAFRLQQAWAMPDRDGPKAQAFYRELGLIGRYMTAIDREMAAIWARVFGPDDESESR